MKGDNTFYNYVKKFLIEHKMLIIFCLVELLFIYGVRIFGYNIGVDTENSMIGSPTLNQRRVAMGRFGLVLLKYIQPAGKFNLYAANFFAVLFLLFSSLFWCMIFDFYSKVKSNIGYFVFSLFYLSSPIWVEVIYFTTQAAETVFIVALCPICIYFMWEGMKKNRKIYTVGAICALAFLISVYQAVIAMFCAGIFIVYILEIENGKLTDKQIKKLFINIVMSIACALVLYFVANSIFINLIFRIDKSSYLTKMIGGNKGESITGKVALFFAFIYKIFFINTPIHGKLVAPILVDYMGSEAVEHFTNAGHFSCILYLPALIYYVICICRNKIRSIFYFLAGAGILGCAVIFVIAAGGSVAARTLYAFALAGALLLYYTITHVSKRAAYVWCALVVLFGCNQTLRSSLLLTSDQVRYEREVWLCDKINDEIQRIKNISHLSDEKVLVVGKHEFDYGANFLAGDMCGQSVMSWFGSSSKNESTSRTLAFMKAHGYSYNAVKKDDENIDELRSVADGMPKFPEEGWVAEYNGSIIVKLSDFIYTED